MRPDPVALSDDEVLDLWCDVLHTEGLAAINKNLQGDLLDYEWERICNPFTGFAYFLRWYGSIRIKGRGDGRGWQPFCPGGEPRGNPATGKDWGWQLKLAEMIPTFDIWCWEKTRQIGITFEEADYALWFAGTQKEQPVLLLSNKLPSAKRLLRRSHVSHYRLPPWLKERMKMTSNSIELTQFANGSTIEPLSSSSDTGRSEAAGLIIADEWAYVEKQEDVHTSIDAAAEGGGQVIYSSTANGVGDMFYEWCCEGAAGKMVGELAPGIGVYESINGMGWTFIPWWAHPDRTVEWRESAARRYKGAYAKFVQEYPNDWLEAFISSGQSYHDQARLEVVERKALEVAESRDRRGTLLWVDKDLLQVKFVPDPMGMVTVHASEAEIDEARSDPRPWVIGADSAGDAPWGDFHAATAWKQGLILPETPKSEEKVVVPHTEFVTIHGYADADAYAEYLIRLGYWLNTALVVPEANAVGVAVIHYMRNARYPRIYRRRPTSERQEKAPQALIGYWMGQASKHEAYGELERQIKTGEAELRDTEGIRELRQVRFLGAGRIGVPEPGHDDRADAKALAATSIRFARSLVGRREELPSDPFSEHLAMMKRVKGATGRIGTEQMSRSQQVMAAARQQRRR